MAMAVHKSGCLISSYVFVVNDLEFMYIYIEQANVMGDVKLGGKNFSDVTV